jgi:hypothetical protein
LSADLQEDLAYALNSYNWISFRTREFYRRRRAGYLGDVDYFNRELDYEDDNGDVNEDGDTAVVVKEGAASDGQLQGRDNDYDDGGPAWTQPPDISERRRPFPSQ